MEKIMKKFVFSAAALWAISVAPAFAPMATAQTVPVLEEEALQAGWDYGVSTGLSAQTDDEYLDCLVSWAQWSDFLKTERFSDHVMEAMPEELSAEASAEQLSIWEKFVLKKKIAKKKQLAPWLEKEVAAEKSKTDSRSMAMRLKKGQADDPTALFSLAFNISTCRFQGK